MSDENKQTQDTLPEKGQPSSVKGSGTSTKAPKTYTEAEFQKALSDRLAKAGREKATELQSQITELQRQLDEREMEGIKDNPDAQTSLQLKRQLRDATARLKQSESDIEQLREKANKVDEYERREQVNDLAREVAGGYDGITVQDLIDFTDGSPERMDAYAKKHGKPKGETPTGEKPDSGVTSGSSTKLGDLPPKERVKATEKKLSG